ncbi:hypothetical protein GCM10025858_29410 [Alicyclobacillus sacchari]|nr:hypothetical protein GCM10025858_29410 [Alicyclobacillus sacchari]
MAKQTGCKQRGDNRFTDDSHGDGGWWQAVEQQVEQAMAKNGGDACQKRKHDPVMQGVGRKTNARDRVDQGQNAACDGKDDAVIQPRRQGFARAAADKHIGRHGYGAEQGQAIAAMLFP